MLTKDSETNDASKLEDLRQRKAGPKAEGGRPGAIDVSQFRFWR